VEKDGTSTVGPRLHVAKLTTSKKRKGKKAMFGYDMMVPARAPAYRSLLFVANPDYGTENQVSWTSPTSICSLGLPLSLDMGWAIFFFLATATEAFACY
jgi:hypothetical protein